MGPVIPFPRQDIALWRILLTSPIMAVPHTITPTRLPSLVLSYTAPSKEKTVGGESLVYARSPRAGGHRVLTAV